MSAVLDPATYSQQLDAKVARLRELLALRPRIEVDTLAAEVLYDARDPYTRKVVIDQGRILADGPKAEVVQALQQGKIGRAQV